MLPRCVVPVAHEAHLAHEAHQAWRSSELGGVPPCRAGGVYAVKLNR